MIINSMTWGQRLIFICVGLLIGLLISIIKLEHSNYKRKKQYKKEGRLDEFVKRY